MFERQLAFVDSLPNQIETVFRNTIEEHGLELKSYIVNTQLYEQGIDGDGKRLEGYKRTTIRYKIAKRQPVDRTTTRDEGFFHAEIEIRALPDTFEVSTNVSYDKYILKRYGRNILKVTNENMTEFLQTYFVKNLKRYATNQ